MPIPFLYEISFFAFFASLFLLFLFAFLRNIRRGLFNFKYLDISLSSVYEGEDEDEDEVNVVSVLDDDLPDDNSPDDRAIMHNIIADIESVDKPSNGDSFLKDWWSRFKYPIEDGSYKALLFSFRNDSFVLVSYSSFTIDVLSEVDKKLSEGDNLLRYLVLQKRSLYFKGDIDNTPAFEVLFSPSDRAKYNHFYIFPVFDKDTFLGSLLLLSSDESLSFASSIASSSS